MLAASRSLLRASALHRFETAHLALWSSTTSASTKEGLPGQDTHDDFKPQVKEGPAGSVNDIINQDLKNNNVFVYMKALTVQGVPEAPQCGFSNAACRILDAYRVKYGSRNVLMDPDLRDAIKTFSQWPTIPQIYVKGEFIGGSDLLMELHQKGELELVLKGESPS